MMQIMHAQQKVLAQRVTASTSFAYARGRDVTYLHITFMCKYR